MGGLSSAGSGPGGPSSRVHLGPHPAPAPLSSSCWSQGEKFLFSARPDLPQKIKGLSQ